MSDESKKQRIKRLTKEVQKGKPHKISISSALEFRRDAYDLKAYEFAKILGLQRSHYSEIVNEKRRLPYDAARRAFAIGVPAEILLQ